MDVGNWYCGRAIPFLEIFVANFHIGSLQCADFVEPTLQRNLTLSIPRKGIARPQSQFPHIYSHVRSTYFPAAE
jgi:hypothetical protein